MPYIIGEKFKRVDPDKELFLGEQHERGGQRCIDKRCDYCGRWISFNVRDVWKWGDNVKRSFNGLPEKVHCGNGLCQDYHVRVLAHKQRVTREMMEAGRRHFERLKRKGLVA